MVSGKPYISTNSATMNAEKLPNVRQSRLVFGLKKLKANRMKIAELMTERDHSPYAGVSWFMRRLLVPTVGGQRRLGGGERRPRPPAAGARLGVDELGQIGLAHAVGHGVEIGGGAAKDHDADAEPLAHVAPDQLHLRRVLLVADEAGQRPRAALVGHEPQVVAAHEEQLVVELRVLVEVAHGGKCSRVLAGALAQRYRLVGTARLVEHEHRRHESL